MYKKKKVNCSSYCENMKIFHNATFHPLDSSKAEYDTFIIIFAF